MHQAICDCGRNPDNKWFVYCGAPRDGWCRAFIVCPGCGEGRWEGWAEGWAEVWREAAGADPVEGPEGGAPEGLQAGVHEGLHASQARMVGRSKVVEAGFDRQSGEVFAPAKEEKRGRGRPKGEGRRGGRWAGEGMSGALEGLVTGALSDGLPPRGRNRSSEG